MIHFNSIDRCGSHKASLYRPYLDLSPASAGPFHVRGVSLAYENAARCQESEHIPRPLVQSLIFNSFRRILTRETRLPEFNIEFSTDLAENLRTPQWAKLTELTREYRYLSDPQKILTTNLLVKLCLYREVIWKNRHITPTDNPESSLKSQLAYKIAISRYMLDLDYGESNGGLELLKALSYECKKGTKTRADSLYQLVVYYGKIAPNRRLVSELEPMLTESTEALKGVVSDQEYLALTSRCHRSAAFSPMLQNNRELVRLKMDMAEEAALAMSRKSTLERLCADEILQPVYESRSKEAIWNKDFDLAESWARKSLKIDSQNPRSWLELGEILLLKSKIKDATNAYLRARSLGPPGTEIATFMAGQCFESLAQPERALELYLAALEIDPGGLTSAKGALRVAKLIGNRAIASWAESHLNSTQEIATKLTQNVNQRK
ncbi:MAG: hypothetical protein AAF604_24115 [Acidobacteriota bacterium]